MTPMDVLAIIGMASLLLGFYKLVEWLFDAADARWLAEQHDHQTRRGLYLEDNEDASFLPPRPRQSNLRLIDPFDPLRDNRASGEGR